MNIKQEAKTIVQSIIEWCYQKETSGEDENYPSHIVENLLERQKAELTEKACRSNYQDETNIEERTEE